MSLSMSLEAGFVFALIAVAAVLMASNWLRFDIVALLVVLALLLSGVLSVTEALAGFGNPVVLLVAGLLVVGEMLDRTGVARAVGDLILKQGGSNETRLLVAIMLGAALLGAVMSSTAVVAIFIPIVLLRAGDTLVVVGRAADRERLCQEQSLTPLPANERRRRLWLCEMGGVSWS